MPPEAQIVLSGDRHEQSAVLRLELVELLPAFEFSLIIQSISDLYFGHLWLSLAERAAPGEALSDPYAPKKEEDIYLERVEVGTPNFVELVGQAVHLLPTFVTVAGTLGAGAKLCATAYKDFAEARKNIAEKRKIEIETKLLQLNLEERARNLHKMGKVTAEQVAHKKQLQETAVSHLSQLLPPYASSSPEIKLVDQPLAKRVHDTSNLMEPADEESSDT